MSWLSYFAIMIAIHQFLLLFYSIGYILPVRFLLGAFMCLQMLVGPCFAYNGLDEFQRSYYKMQVSEFEYFSYAIPAVLLFIAGLHVSAGKLKGEIIDRERLQKFISRNNKLAYIFIGIGFVSSIVSGFFRSEFAFVFTLLGSFKFIGVFMIILGGRKLKPIIIILIYAAIIGSSLAKAMFHDLLIWLLFLGAVLSIKYKPSNIVKAMMAISFIAIAVFIQMIKGDYRKAAWGDGEEGSIELLNQTVENKESDKGLFNYESLASSNIRINQGFIVTNIMKTVPQSVPHENGAELLLIIESAVLPRILAPHKLNAGDREIFMKYSGIPIQQGTSMGLSSLGDGYINFGLVGGAIFMFFYGLLFSEILNLFSKYSRYYPILIVITPLIFYYPIRPDCELQTILGHLVKSCFLVFIILQVWKHIFRERRNRNTLELNSK